jgi:peptidyl-tRNA hydrolase, PTH2 family
MPEPKQVIVMRTDLKMRKGKMVAQGAHASMKVILDRWSESPSKDPSINSWTFSTSQEAFKSWLEGRFTKICVRVESEEELDQVYNKAKEAGLPCALIIDSGLTEFHGIPTKTCCAIGPAQVEHIDPVTSHLKLL